ncbi:cyanophycinase [Leptolyngbya sp. FACHB-261]|nr:cyanophycinase [Leptolyngbya sp. FACHB-261]
MPHLEEHNTLESPLSPSLKAAVMAIGGAEDKVGERSILKTFFNRAGAADARVAIIPSASREPEIIGQIYHQIFEEMGAKSIDILDIRNRRESEDPRMQERLEDCTGAFMTGGDQLRLCALIAETPLALQIQKRVRSGQLVLAGTSAGAAVMGYNMISGGASGEPPNRGLVDLGTGLGIIPEVIVDQHFHNRNRMARLMSAVAAFPERIGIGIDEDTCAVFEGDGTLQVVGKGTVTVVDPGEVSYNSRAQVGEQDPLSICNLKVHILSQGGRYSLYKRAVLQQII